MTNQNKPVAIVCSEFRWALDWAQRHLDIDEYNNQNRRIIDFTGQEYVVITNTAHANGFEFSGMHVIHNSNHLIEKGLIDYVKERIR